MAAVSLPGAASAPFSAPTAQAPSKKRPPAKEKESSLTGCVDEQDGRYILVDERDLKPVADLEADGFPTEGFAKHMGHKITVRGTSNSAGSRPVFRVRVIEPVSDACAPQAQQQGK
jgi:hypothetical protein